MSICSNGFLVAGQRIEPVDNHLTLLWLRPVNRLLPAGHPDLPALSLIMSTTQRHPSQPDHDLRFIGHCLGYHDPSYGSSAGTGRLWSNWHYHGRPGKREINSQWKYGYTVDWYWPGIFSQFYVEWSSPTHTVIWRLFSGPCVRASSWYVSCSDLTSWNRWRTGHLEFLDGVRASYTLPVFGNRTRLILSFCCSGPCDDHINMGSGQNLLWRSRWLAESSISI